MLLLYSKTLNNRRTPNSRPTLPLAGYYNPPILGGLAGYSDPSSLGCKQLLGHLGWPVIPTPPPNTSWLLQPPTCSVHALIRHTRDTWCKTTQTSTHTRPEAKAHGASSGGGASPPSPLPDNFRDAHGMLTMQPRHATPCRIMSSPVMSCHAVPYHIISYYIMACHARPHHAI